MSVQNNIAGGESVVLERPAVGGVYASLFEKINLNPVSELSALDIWQDAQAMNTDSRESNSLSQPVVIRVYQLKDRKTFDKTVYQQLLQDDSTILKDDMLASRDVVVKPGGDANLDMPMEEKAQFVAVVGLFRHPDMDNNAWKQVIKRSDLDPDKPRILEAGDNSLTLQPLKED